MQWGWETSGDFHTYASKMVEVRMILLVLTVFRLKNLLKTFSYTIFTYHGQSRLSIIHALKQNLDNSLANSNTYLLSILIILVKFFVIIIIEENRPNKIKYVYLGRYIKRLAPLSGD